MLEDFSKVSGLRLNDKKTKALWIGASIGNDKIQLFGKELKWPEDKVKSLGLWISTDRELSASLNYNEKLIVQAHMLLTSTKVVIGNQFARGVFYRKLTGTVDTVCNELYPLYKKWIPMRTVGKSQGLINIIN